MNFFVVGVNHKTAPVELREQLAVNRSDMISRANLLKATENLGEIVLLSTCNRVEVYATALHQRSRTSSILRTLCPDLCDLRSHAYVYDEFAAACHLFRVASGLDSMMLGETEITGQVKRAYESAFQAKLTGRTLNRVFQTAFRVAKEIRTSTGIGRGPISVGGAAVGLAEKIFQHELLSHSVLIIGAGQVGEACVRHFVKKGLRSILVTNRSFERAVQLASEFGGQAVQFEDYVTRMIDVDIVVVSSGSPKILVTRKDIERVMDLRRNRPLILIDISVPRNVAPEVQDLENVYLYNIDDLEAIVRENTHARGQEIALSNRIVEDRATALIGMLKSEETLTHPTARRFPPSLLANSMAVAVG